MLFLAIHFYTFTEDNAATTGVNWPHKKCSFYAELPGGHFLMRNHPEALTPSGGAAAAAAASAAGLFKPGKTEVDADNTAADASGRATESTTSNDMTPASAVSVQALLTAPPLVAITLRT